MEMISGDEKHSGAITFGSRMQSPSERFYEIIGSVLPLIQRIRSSLSNE